METVFIVARSLCAFLGVQHAAAMSAARSTSSLLGLGASMCTLYALFKCAWCYFAIKKFYAFITIYVSGFWCFVLFFFCIDYVFVSSVSFCFTIASKYLLLLLDYCKQSMMLLIDINSAQVGWFCWIKLHLSYCMFVNIIIQNILPQIFFFSLSIKIQNSKADLLLVKRTKMHIRFIIT